MKNKIIAIALIVVMSMMLIACGSTGEMKATEYSEVSLTSITSREQETEGVPTVQAEEPQVIIGQATIGASSYEEAIARLAKKIKSTVININTALPVLAVSDWTYDDGNGNQVAMACEIYYLVDGSVKYCGLLASEGTAYPITHDNTGFYVTGGHSFQHYVVSEDGSLNCDIDVQEDIDADGNSVFTQTNGDMVTIISEDEFYAFFETSRDAIAISFSE